MTTMPEPANEKDPGALGADLAETIKRAGGKPDKAITATIGKLKKGETPTNKQLLGLRDFINETAAQAREDEKGEVASRLSALNRGVRRLERSTR